MFFYMYKKDMRLYLKESKYKVINRKLFSLTYIIYCYN